MGRIASIRRALAACLAALAVTALPAATRTTAGPEAASPGLTVALAIERPTVVQPFPSRLRLSLRNAGSSPIWLYRPIQDPRELARDASRMPESDGSASNWSWGGSSLVIHLEPAASGAAAPAWASPPHGTVMLTEGMPHARLVKLAPGGERTEDVAVELDPALVARSGANAPLWGPYRLSVTYRAAYSNGSALSRDLGADIWQGEAASNAIDVDLEPAPAAATGTISGEITGEHGGALSGILVSLADNDEHLAGQMLTDDQGRFAFGRLSAGRYFVTARRPGATTDASIYGHADVGGDAPEAAVNLVLLDREATEPKDLMHKPVLLRVLGSSGDPLGGVQIEALWSSGSVADTVKAETDADGAVAVNLLPGRIYLTLKHRKCSSEDRRVDVAEGDGVDGSILQYDCKPR